VVASADSHCVWQRSEPLVASNTLHPALFPTAQLATSVMSTAHTQQTCPVFTNMPTNPCSAWLLLQLWLRHSRCS
jgi:hypothetical protein